MLIDQRKLKLLVLASCHDECIMIYFNLFVLASWQGFYSPIDPKVNAHLCLDMAYPPAKFDVDWSKETQVIVKKLMFHLKPLFSASWQGFYSSIDPKNNPHLCLDMISTHLQSLKLIDQRKLKLS